MPKNINCISIVITWKDVEKIKALKKMATMKSEEYFFHQRYKKAATNTVMASRF